MLAQHLENWGATSHIVKMHTTLMTFSGLLSLDYLYISHHCQVKHIAIIMSSYDFCCIIKSVYNNSATSVHMSTPSAALAAEIVKFIRPIMQLNLTTQSWKDLCWDAIYCKHGAQALLVYATFTKSHHFVEFFYAEICFPSFLFHLSLCCITNLFISCTPNNSCWFQIYG